MSGWQYTISTSIYYIIYNKVGTFTFLYMAHLKGYLKELATVIMKTSRQNSLAKWQTKDQ